MIGERYRRLIADRAVWSYLIVVSTPMLKLFSCIGKGQKPMRVQTFRSKAPVKRFNKRVVGLFTLMDHEPTRMSGFTMIDFPADFAGTKIGDSEDFVVQPFIDLLAQEGYESRQLIVTGASFSSLSGVNRIDLREPHVS